MYGAQILQVRRGVCVCGGGGQHVRTHLCAALARGWGWGGGAWWLEDSVQPGAAAGRVVLSGISGPGEVRDRGGHLMLKCTCQPRD